MMKFLKKIIFGITALCPTLAFGEIIKVDLVIYGGTSSGCAAAYTAKKMGLNVILVSPEEHLGGLTSNGLGATDIGSMKEIRAFNKEYYTRIGKHYNKKGVYLRFEPHVAEGVFNTMLKEQDVKVLRKELLDREKGVKKSGTKIVSLTMKSGLEIQGKCFIDATYEGDLLAAAGVSYHVGREANAKYGEKYNGWQGAAKHHQFPDGISPYKIAGDPSSGLLPSILPKAPYQVGEANSMMQGYCFRMCLTNVEANRIPFPKPKNYKPEYYELLLRLLKKGIDTNMNLSVAMPNGKTDTNNKGPLSYDFIGNNYDWPEASYEERKKMYQEHKAYQQGLLWFLCNDPRVPEKVRVKYNKWGLCKDEFETNGGWPYELYIREGRRLIGEHVMTDRHCLGCKKVKDPVVLAGYMMDSHNCSRFVNEKGFVKNEGDVQIGLPAPYGISWRSMLPKKSECSNLIVSVCVSSSHIAYGSIRMEPIFMNLGEVAGRAAKHAMTTPLHDIDYRILLGE